MTEWQRDEAVVADHVERQFELRAPKSAVTHQCTLAGAGTSLTLIECLVQLAQSVEACLENSLVGAVAGVGSMQQRNLACLADEYAETHNTQIACAYFSRGRDGQARRALLWRCVCRSCSCRRRVRRSTAWNRATAALARAICAVSSSTSVTCCASRWNTWPVNLDGGKHETRGTLPSRNSARSRFGPGAHARCNATARTISPIDGPSFAPLPAHERSIWPTRSSCSATQSSTPDIADRARPKRSCLRPAPPSAADPLAHNTCRATERPASIRRRRRSWARHERLGRARSAMSGYCSGSPNSSISSAISIVHAPAVARRTVHRSVKWFWRLALQRACAPGPKRDLAEFLDGSVPRVSRVCHRPSSPAKCSIDSRNKLRTWNLRQRRSLSPRRLVRRDSSCRPTYSPSTRATSTHTSPQQRAASLPVAATRKSKRSDLRCCGSRRTRQRDRPGSAAASNLRRQRAPTREFSRHASTELSELPRGTRSG